MKAVDPRRAGGAGPPPRDLRARRRRPAGAAPAARPPRSRRRLRRPVRGRRRRRADPAAVGHLRRLPGHDASKDELAKWLAKQADKHGLPPELPVMASLVESGVKNINYGDADSVGFFQMRVGIWNQGAYAGYPQNPELQAEVVHRPGAGASSASAIAAGDANFGKDPSKWGEWIADIERPAEQYRGRYQLRLGEARGLLKG